MAHTAKVLARFPEYHYKGPMLRIYAMGEGSSKRIAVKQAIKNMLMHPSLFHKSPNYINVEIVTDHTMPFLGELPRG